MSFNKWFMVLVEQTWAGDIEAFEKLYQMLYRFLVSYTGDCNAACDLAQETLIKAWDKWPNLRDTANVKSWLFTIAVNHAKDHLRKQKRNHQLSSLEILIDQEEFNIADHISVTNVEELPEQALELIEERRRVRQAIAQVSPKYRDCVILYIVEDVTQLEIASLLGKDVRTVQRYINQGKMQLRQAYLCESNGQSIHERGGQSDEKSSPLL